MPESRWTVPVDLYCERLGPGLWAEPVNAVSNAAFIVAALAALALLRRRGERDVPALLLIGVAFAVGVGSFLFHTFANRWSLLADVVPIGVFIYGYLGLALKRFVGWPVWAALLGTGLFAAFNVNVEAIAAATLGREVVALARGSLGYAPAALALVVVGAGLLLTRAEPRTRAAARALLLAAGVFALSLAFRTADIPVCGRLPLGTHFLWHVLNGTVLFILLRAAVRHGRATS